MRYIKTLLLTIALAAMSLTLCFTARGSTLKDGTLCGPATAHGVYVIVHGVCTFVPRTAVHRSADPLTCAIAGGVTTVHRWRADEKLLVPTHKLTLLRCGERGLWAWVRAEDDGFSGWARAVPTT